MKTVGAYDAKTHLPRLLDEVADGATVTITKHGRAVARLVPARPSADGGPDDLVAAFRRARQGVHLGDVTVRDLIEEGRR